MLRYAGLALLFICLQVATARAAEPATTAWIVNPQARGAQNASLARILPEVHSVETTERHIEIRSSGASLFFFGPLQSPGDRVERVRELRFRIPRTPAPARGEHARLRPDVAGVFVTGVPIYNQFESASYEGRNLWHFDPIAGGDDGGTVAGGRPRAELAHGSSLGVLEALISNAGRHSPIVGYALDGYPIYGPWGNANPDGSGGLRRMRSGYRLRKIDQRVSWPDGTALTPAQHGPPVDAAFPLGTFVEDYEFVAGTGDLDRFNGRFTRTPEYPNGTYAYFLTTDAQGRLAFPYLLGDRYFGSVTRDELLAAVHDAADEKSAPDAGTLRSAQSPLGANASSMALRTTALMAGRSVRLSFQAMGSGGAPIRFLEYVHERPVHLLIVSEDLAEFDHIHPELTADDRYEVAHQFRHGGRYRLYADFTPPGAAQRIEVFDLTIAGAPRPRTTLQPDAAWNKTANGLRLELSARGPLRVGDEIEFAFTIRDAATRQPVADLEPYLGAWAHFVLLDRSMRNFLHAHPYDETTASTVIMSAHCARMAAGAPPPREVRFRARFPEPGRYKLWAQFQRNGEVMAMPFVFDVAELRQPQTAK